MNSFNGVVLYVLIWWTVLFAVLPFGTQAVSDADPKSGWRGAPARPKLWTKVIATTLVSGVIWGLCALLITSKYVSFRHGYFALPEN
jgi:predicted secreted protein